MFRMRKYCFTYLGWSIESVAINFVTASSTCHNLAYNSLHKGLWIYFQYFILYCDWKVYFHFKRDRPIVVSTIFIVIKPRIPFKIDQSSGNDLWLVTFDVEWKRVGVVFRGYIVVSFVISTLRKKKTPVIVTIKNSFIW